MNMESRGRHGGRPSIMEDRLFLPSSEANRRGIDPMDGEPASIARCCRGRSVMSVNESVMSTRMESETMS